MSGMRKVGTKIQSLKKKLDHKEEEEEELDFNQELDEYIQKEDNPSSSSQIEKVIKDSEVKESVTITTAQDGMTHKIGEETSLQELSGLEGKRELSMILNLRDDIVLDVPDTVELPDENQSSSEISIEEDVERRSVFIKNVDYSATPEELEEHFRECGTIVRVTILIDKYTGRPKGYAFIEFANIESKEKAKELNNSVFKDRQIKVGDKRKNIPDYFAGKSKSYSMPVFSNKSVYTIGGNINYFGPMKGRFLPNRTFQPY